MLHVNFIALCQWNLKVKKSTKPQWGLHSHDLNICQRPHLLRDCCCYSVAQPCLSLCDPMNCSMPGFPVLHYLPKYVQTHVHWVNDTIQSSHLLSPHSPPVLNVSQHQSLSHELSLHIRWPKYWSFSFSSSPWNEYSGLISFRIDWFDLRAVQGTFRSLFQPHSSKAPILWCSTFFKVLLSQSCVTTGKNIALTIWTFVGRAISLFFNTVSRFVNYILQ